MTTISLQSYCQNNNIAAVSTIYASKEHNYPMVALTDNDDKVHHHMLSKSAGEKWPVGTAPRAFAREAMMTTFDHEALGETVVRMSTGSVTESVVDLFG